MLRARLELKHGRCPPQKTITKSRRLGLELQRFYRHAMKHRTFAVLLTFAIAGGRIAASGAQQSDTLLAKASSLLGAPLNPEHRVFSLGGNWVAWLIEDTSSDLIEVDVAPKSHYRTEFPNSGGQSEDAFLTIAQYKEKLNLISLLRDMGRLQAGDGDPASTAFGLISTDKFEKAFVERMTRPDNDQHIVQFIVYYVQDAGISPEELAATPSMVCFGEQWYYTANWSHPVR